MTITHTNGTVLAAAGIDTTNLEFPELGIPVLTGIQRQGDLMLLPVAEAPTGVPIDEGVAVVAAESAVGNAHILIGDGQWQRAEGDVLVEGWVTVPEGGEVFLIHTEEHNALGIGPGRYEIRRQREWDALAASDAFDASQLAEERTEEAERRRLMEERIAYRRVHD